MKSKLKEQLGDLAPNKLCYELAKAKALVYLIIKIK